ncbi:hypothetical protein IE53DRAFT_411895 [Violaceomyces palustris]|uniref:Uncharacterized protein n=1 Tax=Violaceomyces palustris TaxID=1673888 RepID=A0ACD0NTC7_9BASI|nr:hypothetical protein IE53DRAFT_411895 [Violaceomyces palustris]
MLEQHASHVYSLSTSPHRTLSSQSLDPLNKTPRTPTFSDIPPEQPKPYRPSEWSLISISRPSTTSARLIVTLEHLKTKALFAWPMNLATPEKGTCYVTPLSPEQEDQPPDELLSISLKVLTDVIRSWMVLQKSLGVRRASASHWDVDAICRTLGLKVMDQQHRGEALARQNLPMDEGDSRPDSLASESSARPSFIPGTSSESAVDTGPATSSSSPSISSKVEWIGPAFGTGIVSSSPASSASSALPTPPALDLDKRRPSYSTILTPLQTLNLSLPGPADSQESAKDGGQAQSLSVPFIHLCEPTPVSPKTDRFELPTTLTDPSSYEKEQGCGLGILSQT